MPVWFGFGRAKHWLLPAKRVYTWLWWVKRLYEQVGATTQPKVCLMRMAVLFVLLAVCTSGSALAAVQPIIAAPPAAAASFLRAEDHRVAAVAYRLGMAGAQHCPVSSPLTGMLLHHLPEYDAQGRRAMIDAHQLQRGPGILSVIADSPAARARLRAGDVLLTMNGQSFDSPLAMAAEPDRKRWRALIEQNEGKLEDQLRSGPVRLTILRDGREIAVPLTAELGCPTRIRLARSAQVNAFASGRYVIMTTALLNFVQSDDELAVVIAHELAHNILAHPDRLKQQKVPARGFLRGFGKNASRVRVTEEEADRLGIKLAWAAGYKVSAAIPFWRRFYKQFDGPQLFRTHPSLEARERLTWATIAELKASAK